MAQTPIHTTIVGRLVADPEVRYTNDGKPVASFTIASSQRVYNKQTGQWEDGEATFLGCTAWSKLAEGVATLGKRPAGDRHWCTQAAPVGGAGRPEAVEVGADGR